MNRYKLQNMDSKGHWQDTGVVYESFLLATSAMESDALFLGNRMVRILDDCGSANYPKSSMKISDYSQNESGEVNQSKQISNARLIDLASKNPPPQEWFDSDEEQLF